jgi:hypothetical protein
MLNALRRLGLHVFNNTFFEPHDPAEIREWIHLDIANIGTTAASTAIYVWENLARAGNITPENAWAVIVDPGGDAAYENEIGPSLEALWRQIDAVPRPARDGWVAVVGPGASGFGYAKKPPANVKPVIVSTVVTGEGYSGFATYTVGPLKKASDRFVLGSFSTPTNVTINVDTTRWLANIAGIRLIQDLET